MAFKSQAQARYFFAAQDSKHGIGGLSKNKAKEFITDTNHQKLLDLPEHAKKPVFTKLKQRLTKV